MIIPPHNYTQRESSVCDVLKNLNNPINSFINVGFHDWQDPRRHWWIKVCDANQIDWHIVEVFKPNVDDAISKGCPPEKIHNLSIDDVEKLPNADVLMFWHGPEHLEKSKFLSLLPKLESKYTYLIFGMPLGDEPQGEAYGNPAERHISAWYPNDWKSLGYNVVEVHDRQRYPHITAFKDTSK
jgi:hypothetical protein